MSLVKPQERRQFGRLKTTYHAWIRIAGRPALPCVVRDLSVTGAGVELADDCTLPTHFTLVIDSVSFVGACQVRHREGTKLGVEFTTRGAERTASTAQESRPGAARR